MEANAGKESPHGLTEALSKHLSYFSSISCLLPPQLRNFTHANHRCAAVLLAPHHRPPCSPILAASSHRPAPAGPLCLLLPALSLQAWLYSVQSSTARGHIDCKQGLYQPPYQRCTSFCFKHTQKSFIELHSLQQSPEFGKEAWDEGGRCFLLAP